ncbi:hypothetical protein RhiirA5_431209 [Rhizophagus irregularis]|uniref:Uncharacterized protein n=1 Tax=Rhizophagus irregularis TaxID=588596 RepID=A0A2N0NVE3_9GLOM|nr:hypothetical protein RhiirA5_431209 [Rhizophagus irregularis]
MEQPSFTYIVSDYLGQTYKLSDIRSVSKQLKQQKEESALRAEEKRLICMNALWRRVGPSVCVEKGNKLVSSNSLEWEGGTSL